MGKNWLDLQHRGYAAYLSETEGKECCKRLNRQILNAGGSEEKLEAAVMDCVVKTDWIEQIEEGLPFIDNAVRQSRQFILRQGETVPIEKVKRVSKTSVEHLSRHSELITTVPEPGGNLLPDKLHMTENVGTYTVYENRFLYMLLCLIRDFAGFRYKKIQETADSFSAELKLRKQVADGDRKIAFRLEFSESARGMGGSEAEDALLRIQAVLQTVDLLLRTDLMKEVSTAPLLKPPVTKTNVMLHDPNFKAAFALYAFLSAYPEPGFRAVERYRSSGMLSDVLREDLASLVGLTSYLSYRCGGMYGQLQEDYLKEEARRQEDKIREERARLDALRETVGPVEGAAAEYILGLERHLEDLDSREDLLQKTRVQCMQLQQRAETAEKQTEILAGEKRKLEASVLLQEQQVNTLTREKELLIARQEEAQKRFEEEFRKQKQEFLSEYEALMEKYRLASALSRGMEDSDACTSREAFAELEAQYRAFQKFYDRQWKLARKQIRKDSIWKK